MTSISKLLEKAVKEDLFTQRFMTRFQQENSHDWCTDHNEELDMYTEQSDWVLYDYAKGIESALTLEDIGLAKAFLCVYGNRRKLNQSLLEIMESIENNAKIFNAISGVDSIIADLELVGRTSDAKKLREMQISINSLESKSDSVDDKILAITKTDFSKGDVEHLLDDISVNSIYVLAAIETHKLKTRLETPKNVSALRLEMVSGALSEALNEVVVNAKENAELFDLADITHLHRIDQIVNDDTLNKEIMQLVKLSNGQALKNKVFEKIEADAKEDKRNQTDNMWVAHEMATARYKDMVCDAKERLGSCVALDMFLDREVTTPPHNDVPIFNDDYKASEPKTLKPEKTLAALLARKL